MNRTLILTQSPKGQWIYSIKRPDGVYAIAPQYGSFDLHETVEQVKARYGLNIITTKDD